MALLECLSAVYLLQGEDAAQKGVGTESRGGWDQHTEQQSHLT